MATNIRTQQSLEQLGIGAFVVDREWIALQAITLINRSNTQVFPRLYIFVA